MGRQLTRAFPSRGMSGGPNFSLKNNEGYSLIGVVYCGKGPLDDENIEISPDVWIFGFPFHVGLMGAILEYRS